MYLNRSRINYHIIFSNEVEIEDIEENFLHEIEFVHEGLPLILRIKENLKDGILKNMEEVLKNNRKDSMVLILQ